MSGKVSLRLLERRARSGDAWAFGSLALHRFNRTKTPTSVSAEAIAMMERAALAGDNRCSRLLAVMYLKGWRDLGADPNKANRIWRVHRRNEMAWTARQMVAAQCGRSAVLLNFSSR